MTTSKKSLWKILMILPTFFYTQLFSQDFQGTISNATTKKGIDDCYVLLINDSTNEILDYDVPNILGIYHLKLKNTKIARLKLTCQGLSYHAQSVSITLEANKNLYQVDFTLIPKEVLLKEVTVIAERTTAVKVKNDTTIYDVSAFKKAEDTKVIHVLKNMPGIQVDEKTGQVQFKGKPIETILLDGDDLLGSSYAIGARNISADVVDRVEGIEDYHDNKLKKGVINSEKVVLNLKLKKDIAKLSGETSGGFGMNNRHLGNLSALVLSSKIKGLGVFTANNISIDQTSFQKETYQSENKEEVKNYGSNLLSASSATQSSIFPRGYINHLKFGSYNNFFKISEKLKIKNMLSAYSDKRNYTSSSFNNFIINKQEIQSSNDIANISTPAYLALSNEITYDIDSNSSLKYQHRFVDHQNQFYQQNIQNKIDSFNVEVKHKQFYYQQSLNYTYKISPTSLVETQIYQSQDVLNQSFALSSGQREIAIPNYNDFLGKNNQTNRLIAGGSIFYIKKMKAFDIQLGTSYKHDREQLYSYMSNHAFDYHFQNNTTSGISDIAYKYGKISFKAKMELGYSDRQLYSAYAQNLQKNHFFTNAEAKVKVKLGQSSLLEVSNIKNSKMNDYHYLFSNPLLIDTRTIINNRPSIDFLQTWRSSISLSHHNLFKQASIAFLTSYEETSNTFLAEQQISKEISFVTYFQNPMKKKDTNISLSGSFIFDEINNKISISANANFSRYFNALNTTNLSEVWSSNYHFNLSMNSAFNSVFNYKTNIGFTFLQSKQEGSDTFINSTINATIEAIFRFSKKTYCKFENELLLPGGTQITKNQIFTDFSLHHTTRKIDYFIFAKNLLNQSAYQQIFTNEFSLTIFSNGLFPRYIVLGLNYRF